MDLEKYPKLDEQIISVANSNSFSGKRGLHTKSSYEQYLMQIDSCEQLNDNQKIAIATKFHKLYQDYASKDAFVLSPMVTGPARFPTKKNNAQIGYSMDCWEKVEKFMKDYDFIFKKDSYYGKSLREKNLEREALFENDDYKIVEFNLESGKKEKRVGFHFTLRIKRQLMVALKSRGFRWNANVSLWAGKVESYEKHKEWCHSLSENYPNYIK